MGKSIVHKTYKIFLTTFLLNVYKAQTSLAVNKYVTISTKFADLIGTIETVPVTSNHDIKYISFIALRGIPYAESPVERLRWQDSILKQPFPKGTLLNATVDKSPCPQWIAKNGTSALLGNEDCLFASIFIPVQRIRNRPLKIMAFFHGGGFIVNSNRDMLPTSLLAKENCIVVMFNYRISIFGYLSTGTSSLPGNYAISDQINLLRWIQLYGDDLWGDPNDVTIFGSSIGSVSIHYLLLIKQANGLFHKAIMESGSAFCERSLVPNPLDISMKLGSKVGCFTVNDPQELVQCLRFKSTAELMMGAKSLSTQWVLPSVLGPVIDKFSRPTGYQFLSDYPEKLPIVSKVPVIAGITKDEGLTAFVKLSKEFSWEQLHSISFIEKIILPHYLDLIMRFRMDPTQRQHFIENLARETVQLYWNDFAKDTVLTLVDILGDLWINTCHRKSLEHLCMNSVPSVHAYLFTHHDADISPSEIEKDIREFKQSGKNHLIFDKGVAHTEEILYLLEPQIEIMSANRLTNSFRNQLMSSSLSNIWTNFAIFGENFRATVNGWPDWNPVCHNINNYTHINPDYPLYEISLDNHRTAYNFRLKETEFWWKKHLDYLWY